MQSCICTKTASVWPGSSSKIRTFRLIGRKAKCWLLHSVLFAATLAQSPAFATGSVTLAWSASTDPSIAGFNVYYGGASGAYTNEIFAGNATNVTVSGLVSGATYYFAAKSYDTSGVESMFSGEVSYLIPMNVPILNCSNTYIAVVTANAPGFITNRLHQIRPIPPLATNYIFNGFWIYYPPSGVWTLQSSSNLLTWFDYSTGTNAVFIPNTGGNRFFRLKYVPIVNCSNTYIAVVTTNAPGFITNRLHQIRPIPPLSTNYIFTGFWIYYPPLGVWTLQSSSNLLTWFNYSTGTNAVFIPNTGGNRFFRFKSP